MSKFKSVSTYGMTGPLAGLRPKKGGMTPAPSFPVRARSMEYEPSMDDIIPLKKLELDPAKPKVDFSNSRSGTTRASPAAHLGPDLTLLPKKTGPPAWKLKMMEKKKARAAEDALLALSSKGVGGFEKI
jgi:hypothetical protein